MSDINSIIEKVRKLLSLSKSSNINEANVALQAANKLIDQYRLSDSMLETADDPIGEDEPLYETGRVTPWKSTLVSVLAKHYGCVIYNMKVYRNTSIRIIGRKSDTQIVHYMFAWLCSEAERLARIETKKLGHDKSGGKIFCASYCWGFAVGVGEQLAASRKTMAKESGDSTAIVKLDERIVAARDFLNNKHPRLKKVTGSSNSKIDSAAFNGGVTSGRNMHLGARLGQGNTKLLGG